MIFAKRVVISLALAGLLVDCGGSGTSPSVPAPSFTSDCVESLCALSANTSDLSRWKVNGTTYPGDADGHAVVYFPTAGTYPITVTSENDASRSVTQNISIAPAAADFDDVHMSLQLILGLEHSTKLLYELMGGLLPEVSFTVKTSGATINCPGGGTIDASGDPAQLTGMVTSNPAACMAASGQLLSGLGLNIGFADFMTNAGASGTDSVIQTNFANSSDMLPWEFTDINYDISLANGGSTMQANLTQVGPAGDIYELFSNIPCCTIDPRFVQPPIGLLQGSITTDTADTASISGSFAWTGYTYLTFGPNFATKAARVVSVSIPTPLDISQDAAGLHMLSGSIVLTVYVDQAHYTVNQSLRQITVSMPSGGDPTQVQVTVDEGGVITSGLYPQSDFVALPHNCQGSELPLYCAPPNFYYSTAASW